uniref:RNase H type-1 domain-containing protein n=1 Tax=Cannabis sativa TaxID=3483 RepID=A0A803QP40_CANSA
MPVASFLHKKCVVDSPIFPLCKLNPETIKHALLDCSRSKKAWKYSSQHTLHPNKVFDWSVNFFFKYSNVQQVQAHPNNKFVIAQPDVQGTGSMGFSKSFAGCVPPAVTEAKAILQAIQWAQMFHLPVDVLKTECKFIVDKLVSCKWSSRSLG